MSFDLAFWYESSQSTSDAAAQIYDRLTDGETGVVQADPRVDAFYKDLISIYEDLTVENAETSPWMASPYRNSECVIVAISWSRYKNVAPVLLDVANRHGMTAYDPQDRIVYHPTRDNSDANGGS
jgi:hypothetical protein